MFLFVAMQTRSFGRHPELAQQVADSIGSLIQLAVADREFAVLDGDGRGDALGGMLEELLLEDLHLRPAVKSPTRPEQRPEGIWAAP